MSNTRKRSGMGVRRKTRTPIPGLRFDGASDIIASKDSAHPRRARRMSMLRGSLAGLVMGITALAATNSAPVTFNKDVLPILQKNCQGCHRPGELAPMSFLSYSETRPWAKAMKQAVVTKKMPPWSADPHYGPYLNDRSLKQDEIDTIAKWAESGAPAGDPKDAPP